jgi:hypothetical protein
MYHVSAHVKLYLVQYNSIRGEIMYKIIEILCREKSFDICKRKVK